MIYQVSLVAVMITLLSTLAFAINDGSFVDVDPEMRRHTRDLLQSNEEEVSTESAPEVKQQPPKKKGKFVSGEYLLGPKLFFDGSHFAMETGSPIRVAIFDGQDVSKRLATVKLDAPAMSVKGSMINAEKTDFKVNMDWKQQNFGTGDLRITGIQINMYFKLKNDVYFMYHMEVVKLNIGSRYINDNPLTVNNTKTFFVEAPIGSSFTCQELDMFKPNLIETGLYRVGITFPDVRLQVFNIRRNFGPEWDCSNMMPVGLLVGLVLTLFFALICAWGFSMLASINTMDRFDDPKGKQIYIPQSD